MDKLLLSEGGQPLHLDDIEFLQGSTQGALCSLIAALGDYIVGGCIITIDQEPKTASWTAGYISFSGKVYKVTAGHIPMSDVGQRLYWVFSSSRGAIKTFADGAEIATQETYRATLVASSTTPSGAYMAADTALVLGHDIARVPRLPITIDTVEGVEVLDIVELSKHTGVLTLRLGTTGYAYNASIATIKVDGMGLYYAATAPLGERSYIELASDGKLYMRLKPATDGSSFSHYHTNTPVIITFLVGWSDVPSSSSSGSTGDNTTGGIRGRR